MRELSRITRIAPPSTANHLKALLKEGFVVKDKKGLYPIFKANRESERYKLYKKANIMLRIADCGLLQYLYDICLPDVIILFGSCSKGEDIENSDIDIYLQCGKKNLDLSGYESALSRKISVFYSKGLLTLSDELRSNIANGIILKGYMEIWK